MKRLQTAPITASNGFPVTSGTLDFLQASYREIVEEVVKSLIKNYDPTKAYILSGIRNDSNDQVPKTGAIFFNGEVFICSNAQIQGNQTSGAYVVLNQQVVPYTNNADPTQFSGGGQPINVHHDRKLIYTWATQGSGLMGRFEDVVFIGRLTSFPLVSQEISLSANPPTQGGLYYKVDGDVLTVYCNYRNIIFNGNSPYDAYIDLPQQFTPSGSVTSYAFHQTGDENTVFYDFVSGKIKITSDQSFATGNSNLSFTLTIFL